MNEFNSTEICVNVLKTINSGEDLSDTLPSPKLYGCLSLLEENFLIKRTEDDRTYKMTEKGIQYLSAYEKFIELLSQKTKRKEQIVA